MGINEQKGSLADEFWSNLVPNPIFDFDF